MRRPSRKFELRSPAATKSRNSGARHRTADPDHNAPANVDAGGGQDDEKRVQFCGERVGPGCCWDTQYAQCHKCVWQLVDATRSPPIAVEPIRVNSEQLLHAIAEPIHVDAMPLLPIAAEPIRVDSNSRYQITSRLRHQSKAGAEAPQQEQPSQRRRCQRYRLGRQAPERTKGIHATAGADAGSSQT